MEFGSRLKELRKKRGFKAYKVAEDLGFPFSTYSNYENGNREPNFENLVHMCEILHTSADYLLGLTDDDRPQIVVKKEVDHKIHQLQKHYKETDPEKELFIIEVPTNPVRKMKLYECEKCSEQFGVFKSDVPCPYCQHKPEFFFDGHILIGEIDVPVKKEKSSV